MQKYLGERQIAKSWLILLFGIILLLASIIVFYVNFPFAFALMPLIVALSGGAWMLYIDSKKLKEVKLIKQISASTLEILIIHPIFVYYGIGYVYKALEVLKIEIPNAIIIIGSIIVVTLISIICSLLLNKLTSIPSKLYKKYK